MNNIFFSIIVVSYNAEKYITDTINSVLEQDFDDYEIIVKDGLSSDNTVGNIPKSDKIKVFTQKDSGIYDAMNQAIELSSGKYLCFLNCGDFFKNKDVLREIYETAKNHDNAIVYGNYARKDVLFKQPGRITEFYLYRTPLCHQTMFISKKVFNKHGLYNTGYKILADYEHTLHDFYGKTNFVYCDVVVCNYLGGGASETKKGVQIKKEERKKILDLYFPKRTQIKYEFILKLSCRKLRQKLISDNSSQFVRTLYRKIVNLINK